MVFVLVTENAQTTSRASPVAHDNIHVKAAYPPNEVRIMGVVFG